MTTRWRDSIAEVGGRHAPYEGRGDAPVRANERTIEASDEGAQRAGFLCSNGCALDIGAHEGRTVSVRGRVVDGAEVLRAAADPTIFAAVGAALRRWLLGQLRRAPTRARIAPRGADRAPTRSSGASRRPRRHPVHERRSSSTSRRRGRRGHRTIRGHEKGCGIP